MTSIQVTLDTKLERDIHSDSQTLEVSLVHQVRNHLIN
jgi:hypothetical protein